MGHQREKSIEFEGAKLALFLGEKLAVILRDDVPGLPFAGFWDLPGGGREGQETPLGCALRECAEELGLNVPKASVIWQREFADDEGAKWFFVARLPARVADDVIFGDEGQCWTLMTPQAFISHPRAVPAFQTRLLAFLEEEGISQKDPPLP